MGLDNGIILRAKDNNFKENIPNYVNIDNIDDEWEFCYWRKCWGLRNKIINSLCFEENSQIVSQDLTPSNLTDIIQILIDYLIYPNSWDEEDNNLWEFNEMKNRITQDIINLSWLRNYIKENPRAYCYFYDSY